MKVRLGQALSDAEVRTLARTQWAENESRRRAVQATGDPAASEAAVPRSIDNILAGTRIDPYAQRLASSQSQRGLEAEPFLREAQLSQLPKNAALMPVLQETQVVQAQNALAEAQKTAREREEQEVLDQPVTSEALSSMAPPPVAAPVPVAEPPARPATLFDEFKARAVRLTPIERQQQARQVARERVQAAVQAGQRITLGEAAKISESYVTEALNTKTRKQSFADPLTGHVREFEVEEDGLGNVLFVSEPITTKFNPAVEAMDKAFVEENQKWLTNGRPEAERMLANLTQAEENLKKTGLEASMQSGALAGLPVVRSVIDQFTVLPRETERLVRDVTQRSLREILGGQFAMKEGEQLLANAYDRTAKEGTNLKFVQALRATIEEAAQIKAAQSEYFAKNGTLAGFRGPALVSTPQELLNRVQQRTDPAAAATPAPGTLPESASRAVEAYLNDLGS
jgi:hypothetical protein